MPHYDVLVRRTVFQWVTLDVLAKSELAAKRLALRAARMPYLDGAPAGVTPNETWGWDEPIGKPVIVTMTGDDEALADV